jgi:methionine synthase II (cobalamin-independent)
MSAVRLEYLAGRLSSGNATQQERDEIMAVMAIAVKDVIAIDEKIARIHTHLCEHCSVRKRVDELQAIKKKEEEEEEAKSKTASLLSSNKLPWIIILILVVIIASLLNIDLKGIL